MRRPKSLAEQYHGKALAELQRGTGWWPIQADPCHLEPPWEPFNLRAVNGWDCHINEWEGPWQQGLFSLLFPGPSVLPQGARLTLPRIEGVDDFNHLSVIAVEQFPDDESTIPKTEQLLRALTAIECPLSFEVYAEGRIPRYDLQKSKEIMASWSNGKKPRRRLSEAQISSDPGYIAVQFVVHNSEARLVEQQLLAHYPNSAFALHDGVVDESIWIGHRVHDSKTFGAYLALRGGYWFPLRTFTKLDPDPLTVAIGAMEHLAETEWAMLQVLFMPVSQPWDDNIAQAMRNPFQGSDSIFESKLAEQVRQKISSPLFAVSVRLTADREDTCKQLLGWAEQFGNAPSQEFMLNRELWDEDQVGESERALLAEDCLCRCTHRPGMLLNLTELASLIHLPSDSVVSDRLRRLKRRTKPAATVQAEQGSVVLGENLHHGKRRLARLSANLRSRHCYIAGASGTGKSTLLSNMIMQDIEAGQGVGLLDPHGDLVSEVLGRIPEHRRDDVILFDPADKEYPFALNILDAKDEEERERIVSETVMAMERYFPSSWGPRLERILTFTIHSVLDAIPGATLADVERMLTDDAFRDSTASKIKNARFAEFWRSDFKHLKGNAADPVLNKLSVFLVPRVVRNIICQRHSAIDFDELLNGGKILLANLSTGMLTEKVSGMLGSFMLTKIVNAAFRRAALPDAQRRPWHLYVDEFQAFMNLSVGFERVLTEARKYRLILAGLANQYVGQLTPQVRQAIFGNVGTMIVFRLGMDDAALLAKELGAYTAEEIINLDVGEAIVRAGNSASSFNLQTSVERSGQRPDQSSYIRDRCRERYSQPRNIVEQNAPQASARTARAAWNFEAEPSDPNEDDLVT